MSQLIFSPVSQFAVRQQFDHGRPLAPESFVRRKSPAQDGSPEHRAVCDVRVGRQFNPALKLEKRALLAKAGRSWRILQIR